MFGILETEKIDNYNDERLKQKIFEIIGHGDSSSLSLN
jgi:hypothetical protein